MELFMKIILTCDFFVSLVIALATFIFLAWCVIKLFAFLFIPRLGKVD